MRPLILHEVVNVSNNSILTNQILKIINNNLNDNEIQVFRDWLKIVSNKQESSKNTFKY